VVSRSRSENLLRIALKKQEFRALVERFGATKNGPRIAKSLENMVGTRRLELLTSTVSSSRPLTQKELITGGTGRTVILGAICYQIATKNMASGFGAESWGIGPFTSHLNNLIFACGVTYALRVLALPQKATSALPTDISPLGSSSELRIAARVRTTLLICQLMGWSAAFTQPAAGILG
jgi:hypothetical protein